METTKNAKVEAVDMKLEVVVLGVSDVDRAKAFYEKQGWRLDAGIARGPAVSVETALLTALSAPAEKPTMPTRDGSIFHSDARLRTNLTAEKHHLEQQ
jgi:catechol 2,3-dioxygenase-like lactoylglutathione lyase family enzyme